MLTGDYHYSETDISFTDSTAKYSEGELNLTHVNTITNVAFNQHPYDDAFYPAPLPENDPVSVPEPTSALLFGFAGLIALRQKNKVTSLLRN